MYPLVLTAAEIYTLRTMLRITQRAQVMEMLESYRRMSVAMATDAEFALANADKNPTLDLTNSLFNAHDGLLAVDFPLFMVKPVPAGHAQIVNVPEDVFQRLKAISQLEYRLNERCNDADRKIHENITLHMPSIWAALEVAEKNVKAAPTPTQPAASGAN